MKRIFSGLFLLCKWLIAGIILVEIASFLAISLSNYWIYGQLRDGDVVSYDPYALFLEGVRPTLNNPAAPGPGAWTFWLFGGSTMRGPTAFDGHTIPSFLARSWNREEPESAGHHGQPGARRFQFADGDQVPAKAPHRRPSSIPDRLLRRRQRLRLFRPRPHPYGHQGYERVRGMIEDYHRSLFGLLKPLNAAMWSSFTREIYDKMREGVIHIDPGDPRAAAICGQLRPAVRLPPAAAGFGAKFLLVYQPCWWAETKPVAARVQAQEDVVLGKKMAFRDNFRVCYQALVGRLQEKPYFINFRNLLCDRKEPLYQPDGIHLLDAGSKIVASHLAEVLKERLLGGEAPGKPLAGMPRIF